MRAVVCPRYGPPEVLRVREVTRPVPRADEVLVRVRAASVASADARVRASDFPGGFGLPARLALGMRRPRNPILGTDFAGDVVQVGKDVSQFAPGDKVFGASERFGTHAEYVCRSGQGPLTRMPSGLTYADAAAIPFGGISALVFLRDLGRVRSGESLLVVGASGAVGTAAVQLAKYFGLEVTGVCSTGNMELVRSLGAAQVIDYTHEDFRQNGETYDIIFDTVGTSSFRQCKGSLNEGGRYLTAVATVGQFVGMLWTTMTGDKKLKAGFATTRKDDLELLKDLVESDRLRPVIDRCYPFEEAAMAHRHVDGGHKKGNVVLTFGPEP